MMLRYSSVAAQLENDQFNDDECAPGGGRDPVDAAWGRGWNDAVRHVLAAVRAGRAFSTWKLDATTGDEESRAFARGHNAGQRHAVEVRMNVALRELAHAPVIETVNVDFPPQAARP